MTETETIYYDELTEILPASLQTPISESNQEDNTEKREEYHTLEQEISERHSNAYQDIIQLLNTQEETKNLFPWTDEQIPKQEKVVEIKKCLFKNNAPEQLKDKFAKYSQIGWELVLLNHRFIYQKNRRVKTFIERTTSGANIEDLYQESLLYAHNAALNYDPKIGRFITYIGGYLNHHCLHNLLANLGFNSNKVQEIWSAHKALSEEALDETSEENAITLAAALYYRDKSGSKKLKIEFDDNNYLEVIRQLQHFLKTEKSPYQRIYDYTAFRFGKNTDPKDLRERMKKYLENLRNSLFINDPLEIDAEENTQIKDFEGEISHTKQYRRNIPDPLNTESEISRKLLAQKFTSYILEALKRKREEGDEQGVREIELAIKRYGFMGNEPKNKKELAKEYGITEPRIDQILSKFLNKFRRGAVIPREFIPKELSSREFLRLYLQDLKD